MQFRNIYKVEINTKYIQKPNMYCKRFNRGDDKAANYMVCMMF